MVGMIQAQTLFRRKRDIRYFLKYNLDRNEYTINETVIKTKSNVITPVEIASGKKKVDQKNLVVCFIRDISEKNAENKLNLLSLASETTDTIVIADEMGKQFGQIKPT
jgi:hypothetical protein